MIVEVQDHLIVFILCSPSSIVGHKNSDTYGYISSIYSRIWDYVASERNFLFDCAVVIDDADNSKLKQMLSQFHIDALFTDTNASSILKSVASAITDSNIAISDNKLYHKMWTPYISHNIGSATMSATLISSSLLHFFDEPGVSIPLFDKVAVGGTFDRLHNGHRKLLTLATACCNGTFIVGIMSDRLLENKKNSNLIGNFQIRKAIATDFIAIVAPAGIAIEVVELQDPFGPTVYDASIEAIAVSSETIAGAFKINEMRVEKGFKPLSILVTRRTDAATLSSTFIRQQVSVR